LACGVAISADAQPARRSDPVLVRRVIDGDTIDVSGVGRVRLLGIDAPEIGGGFESPAPFAREARDKLAATIASRWVRLEYDEEDRDAHDRRLAYVLLETGACVNTLLVREGLARVSARRRLRRIDELRDAEAEARRWRRGIWSVQAPPRDETGTAVRPTA
jgi:micrococcal nuclease